VTALLWPLPEGLHVEPDGSWRVGDLPVQHEESLRFMKRHLVLDDAGAFVVSGSQRLPVELCGPPFEVVRLDVDAAHGSARATLDDGSQEPIDDASLSMSEVSGRFECLARGGRTRAVFSRAAHQILIEHAVERDGEFFLQAGERLIRIRT
jgi:hypothetical protein